jgi:hypothetical protein
VSWASPNTCGAAIVVTTDAFGLSTTTNRCATSPPGTYTQTATLVSNQQQTSFSYTVQGLSIVLQNIDSVGVRTYDITSKTTQAAGLSVTVRYRSGPVANYVEVLTLNRSVTPAVLTVGFDESQLPIGDYVLDITVSTTTPGFGPAIETVVFNTASSFISNARRRLDSRRAAVAPRAP